MRFLGFFYLKEWDGTVSRCSATEQQADLADYLKYGVDYWVDICYEDEVVHRVDRRYFDQIEVGRLDPNPR